MSTATATLPNAAAFTAALPIVDKVLRTPDERFANLPEFPYQPRYVRLGGLRIACIDEGPQTDAPLVLLMHGEPAWSYLYRKMIPVFVQAGCRVVAPDLVGFGRSDKPAEAADYSYANHVAWMSAWLNAMDLNNITLFCQDWGSLIGLRLAAAMPERFARIVLANGGLPTGTAPVPKAFKLWLAFARWSPWFPIGRIVKAGCASGLTRQEVAAYDAPFPTPKHKIAARLFPTFVPITPDNPERAANEAAWEVFKRWDKPFLTLFSNMDPITRGGHKVWQRDVPGAQGQPHAKTQGAGHFLQEDKGVEVAQAMLAWMQGTP
jgi:haloalkane dehalogenase